MKFYQVCYKHMYLDLIPADSEQHAIDIVYSMFGDFYREREFYRSWQV